MLVVQPVRLPSRVAWVAHRLPLELAQVELAVVQPSRAVSVASRLVARPVLVEQWFSLPVLVSHKLETMWVVSVVPSR